MSSNRKSRLTRLEVLAQMALHAFPARYCRDAARPAATSAAYLDDLARVQILQKLAAMPLIERAILVLVWPPAMVLTALWAYRRQDPPSSKATRLPISTSNDT